MRFLSLYTADGVPNPYTPLIEEYSNPHKFWDDWNGGLGCRMWHRMELTLDGTPYTVKWESRAFRNGAGKSAVHTIALWTDGEHPADTRPPTPPPVASTIPPTQRGRLNRGERLRSPHGTWTVSESWVADKPGAEGKDRDYQSTWVSGGSHVYYVLTHEDGHQEEWSAPDMVDFHRMLPDEQQSLT